MHASAPSSAASEATPIRALPPGFAPLYADHYEFVWRCALRLGVAPAEVEDVVQDCFIVALRRFDDFDPNARGRPSTWLFKILRNVLRNHTRSERRRSARIERYGRAREPAANTEHVTEAALAGRLLDEFLATLDRDKRDVFVLGEIEGMTGPEIAGTLELNLNTANARLRAARQAFTRHFDGSARPPTNLRSAADQRAAAEARSRGLPVIVAASGYGAGGAGASVVWGSLANKLIAGLIFAVASVGAVAIIVEARPAEPAPVASPPPSATTTSVAAAEASPQPPAPPAEPALELEPAAEPAAEPQPPKPASAPTPLERLADARSALLADDPARALALVEHRSFSPKLEGRRVALEIAALCRLDRASEAEARARKWRVRNPDHPSAASMIGVCWTESSLD